jgi:hypothetical protein
MQSAFVYLVLYTSLAIASPLNKPLSTINSTSPQQTSFRSDANSTYKINFTNLRKAEHSKNSPSSTRVQVLNSETTSVSSLPSISQKHDSTTIRTQDLAAATTVSATQVPSSGSTSGGGGTNSGDLTYYDVSVGKTSCGGNYFNNQAVAALHPSQMPNVGNPNDSPSCGKFINLYANGIGPVPVQVVDTCGGCAGQDDVDVTNYIFTMFAPESAGRVSVSWSWA